MYLAVFQVQKTWLMRAILLLAVSGFADAAVGWFAVKPFPWIALIPGSLPLSMFLFVARPLLKEADRESSTAAGSIE